MISRFGNNLMDRWAQFGPSKAVAWSAHVLFWPIVFSQYTLSKLGLFQWYTCVSPHVYLGALPWPHATRFKLLEDEKISSVVNLVGESSRFVPEKWTDRSLKIGLPDFVSPSFNQLKAGIDFIENEVRQGRNVYIHCRAGKGRSATLVACWLVNKRKFTPEAAQAYLSKLRPQILSTLATRQAVLEAYQQRSHHS